MVEDSFLSSLLLSSAPAVPPVNKIVSTAPDLQPKQPSVDDSLLMGDQDEMETGGEPEQKKPEGGEEGEAGDSDSDDDDVQITIGDITTVPGSSYTRTPSYTRVGTTATGGMEFLMLYCGNACMSSALVPFVATGAISTKKVDLEAIPQVGGQNLLEFDLDATERPWRLPGLQKKKRRGNTA